MSVVRAADVACRVGGDEFGVVLPESAGQDAELLAARIAQRIRAKPVGKAGTLNISAGVAKCAKATTQWSSSSVDAALYRAKELGKARTVAADGTAGVYIVLVLQLRTSVETHTARETRAVWKATANETGSTNQFETRF